MPRSAPPQPPVDLPDLSPEMLAEVRAFLAGRDRKPPRQPNGAAKKAGRDGPPRRTVPTPRPGRTPVWDHMRRRLRFCGKTVLEFGRRAPRQIRVLDALERGGWPPAGVPNPFRRVLEPALARRRLHETVTNMNRHLREHGLEIREDGERVWWERVESRRRANTRKYA